MWSNRTQSTARGSPDRIVAALRSGRDVTRAELADRTGLSRATVSTLVRTMERDGLVELVPGSLAAARTGRRPEVVRLTPRAGAVLGIDFGHEHVRVAVGDLTGRQLVAHVEAVDVDSGLLEALDAAVRLAHRAVADAGVTWTEIQACGAGVPGPVDRATGMIGSTVLLPGWNGTSIRTALQERFGVPVAVDNDANLGALGEQYAGAGRGIADLIYVKVSSGVGAGLVSGGRLLHGGTGIAGEIGHVMVVPDGAPCRCGGRGCLETLVSAPAVRRQLHVSTGDAVPNDDLLQALERGDQRIVRLLTDAGRALGRVLANACHLLDPTLIVVGGDPAFASEPVLSGTREELHRHRLPGLRSTPDTATGPRVAAAELGPTGQVVGALRLAANRLAERVDPFFHDQAVISPGGTS